jgi:hypothetical protein
MRELRLSGSEGGGVVLPLSLPLSVGVGEKVGLDTRHRRTAPASDAAKDTSAVTPSSVGT